MKILKITIGKRLALGFGLLLAILVAAVTLSNHQLAELQRTEDMLVSRTLPSTLAASELVSEINRSLAILRGYLVLGNRNLVTERQAVWQQIDKQIARLQENESNKYNIIGYAEALSGLATTLEQFRQAQREAEQVAHTEDERPAMKMYKQDVEPLMTQVVEVIKRLTQIEQSLPATPERKKLLGLLANASASFFYRHDRCPLLLTKR